MEMELQHFNDEAEVRAYVECEMLATLRDDLDRMENAEFQHYSDEDRTEMRARIADVEQVTGADTRLQVLARVVVTEWNGGKYDEAALTNAIGDLERALDGKAVD